MNDTPHTPAAPAEAPQRRPTSRWAIHRRLYDWTLSFSYSKHATLALAFISFIEAIFFPVPPFVLQIPMTLERRNRAWWYALVTTVASVAGGMIGYLLGWGVEGLGERVFGAATLEAAHKHLSDNPVLLTAAVIVVHPYKLFTIAAGLFSVPVPQFVMASAIGRGVLFFGVGGLLWLFGPPVRTFIEKYFNLLTVLFGLIVIGAIVLMKMI